MRDTIWYALLDAQHRALYLQEFNTYVRTIDRVITALAVLTSSGGIGGWLLWQQWPYAWAILVGAAQLAGLLKPVFPHLKELPLLTLELGFYQRHQLELERLWVAANGEQPNMDALTEWYFELRTEEANMLSTMNHFDVPDKQWVRHRIATRWAFQLQKNESLTS
ncbi:MAG: hypothetical protein AAGB22_07585 [Bacteroidota bacterium]